MQRYMPALCLLLIGGCMNQMGSTPQDADRATERPESRPAQPEPAGAPDPGRTAGVVSVRYIVDDVGAAVRFYTERLEFAVDLHPGPGFAALSRGNLRLLLSRPGGGGGAGQSMPGGTRPQPGGWNRIQIQVADLEKEVMTLRSGGARFRNEIVIGNGGKQILLEDPSGNPIELFEPAR